MKDKALEARLTEYLRDTQGLLTVVQPLSGPDGMGRIHLAAFWWADYRPCADDTGPGLRAQHFRVALNEFTARSSRLDGTPRRYAMLDDVPDPAQLRMVA